MAELDSQPKSIQSLYVWYTENFLYVNRRYQRKLVWTLEEKKKLVESLLQRYPIPAILLAEREEGGYEIIDGLQRLHTIMSYIEAGFPGLDNKYFNVAQFPTANTRLGEGVFDMPEPTEEDPVEFIDPKDVSKILDYSMAVSTMRGATEAEIDDVFARINTYGHRLSDQERRQAGVQDSFSSTVRTLACEIRRDASADELLLSAMPSISIDLPKTRHGYRIVAGDVFWVSQGILRSTNLRDSIDEQCIADIAASIVGGDLIERSKEALDNIYDLGSSENERILRGLEAYGADRFSAEFKYLIDQINKVCEASEPEKLRDIILAESSTAPFPSVFAILVVALHEVLIGGRKTISDYAGLKEEFRGMYQRLETSRRSTIPAERRRNVNQIKGLIDAHSVASDHSEIYGAHSTIDIENAVRRSEIETPYYELKQGLLRLDDLGSPDPNIIEKVCKTICAIANNGPSRSGTILVGVADKKADVSRVEQIYGSRGRAVTASRVVVGLRREAEALGENIETYFARWRDGIRSSKLSDPLKTQILSNIDWHDFFGLGVIVITIPPQHDISYFDSVPYYRSGDQTEAASEMRTAVEIGRRFA